MLSLSPRDSCAEVLEGRPGEAAGAAGRLQHLEVRIPALVERNAVDVVPAHAEIQRQAAGHPPVVLHVKRVGVDRNVELGVAADDED